MNNTATDDRNADLIPEILQALKHHEAGSSEKRDQFLTRIQEKLVDRGEHPHEFWKQWHQLVLLYRQV